MSLSSGELTRMLADAVGADHLSGSVADLASQALDFWPRALIAAREGVRPAGPAYVVWPGAAAEVSQVLRLASTHAIPVIPFGGGSSMVGGAAPWGNRPWIVINTQRMCNILDLDEISGVAHVQTGILGVELEERLNRSGFSLGHVPTSMTTATLGGWLSTRSAGLMSSRYGRISEMCLGVTAVLADGQVVHTRVAPRRATGPDLMHLFLGAEGALGVLTAAHLRLHRLPIHRQFDAYRFENVAAATRALPRLLARGVRPLVARIQQDPRQRREVDGEPGRGVEAFPPEASATRLLLLAYEGPQELVEAEASLAADVASAHGGEPLGPAPARRWWGQRFAGVFRLGPILAKPRFVADQMEIAVRWSDVAFLEGRLEETLGAMGIRVHAVVEHARLEGACLSLTFWGAAPEGADVLGFYDEAWGAAAAVVGEVGAGIAHVYGVGRHRMAYLEGAARERLLLLAAVKRKLDPVGILNPGVLGT